MSATPPSPTSTPAPSGAGALPGDALVAALFTQSPLSVALYDADGRVAAGNAAYERHFGIRVADVPPDWSLFADPQLAAAGVLPLVARAYAGEAVTLPAVRYDAAAATGGSGRAVWTEGHCYPVRDAAGRVTHVAVVHVDVTAWAEAEAALARSEAQFRALTEATPAILFLTAPDGQNLYTNPQFQAYAGLSADALLGDGWLRVVHPDDAPAAGAAWAAAVRDGAPYEVEYRFRRHDGAYRWFLGRGLPYRDPATGETACWVGVCTDIDARKAAEAALARAAAEAAQHRAEAANQAKGLFLANMSHELRTPLNAIGGYTQLIELELHGPVTDAQRAALGRVQGAQTRLLSLINDVLNYAKLESGRVEYDVRAVDVRDVVAEVTPLVEPQLRAKGLGFDVRLPGEPCVVWADREKLGQVLVNLLSNAVKFTDAGEGRPGRVTVSVAARAGAAFLRVTDTGVGVPRAKQEAIFEPFVQVRTGYAQATEGTGLGLAISRDLARGMGGDLRVRSREGEGSTFTVALRRVVDGEGRPTDRRGVDERREDERRAEEDRRRGAGPDDPVAGVDADAAPELPPA